MRKLIIWSVAVLAVAASAAVASAAGGGGGKEMTFSVGLSHGSNNYAQKADNTAGGDEYLLVSPTEEVGGNVEFGMGFAEDYSMVLSGDFRFGSTKLEPTSVAGAGNPDLKETSTSWKIRLGGDRTGKIGDRFHWYMGPGIEYGSGKLKDEANVGGVAVSATGEPTNSFGINGRVGGVMMLSPQVGIKGQIGDSFGQASVKDGGGKTTWYYSSFESVWGVQFAFGGK